MSLRPFRPRKISRVMAAFSSALPPTSSFRTYPCEAELRRVDGITRHHSSLPFRDSGPIGHRHLIQPVHPMHHKTMLGAKVEQHLRQQLRQPASKPHHLQPGTSRLVSGPGYSAGADSQFLSRLGAMFHRTVVQRREEKPDSHFVHAIGHPLRRQVDSHTQRRQDIGAARF